MNTFDLLLCGDEIAMLMPPSGRNLWYIFSQVDNCSESGVALLRFCCGFDVSWGVVEGDEVDKICVSEVVNIYRREFLPTYNEFSCVSSRLTTYIAKWPVRIHNIPRISFLFLYEEVFYKNVCPEPGVDVDDSFLCHVARFQLYP